MRSPAEVRARLDDRLFDLRVSLACPRYKRFDYSAAELFIRIDELEKLGSGGGEG